MAVTYSVDQAYFRVGNDDGTEAAYTFAAALNTNWVQTVNLPFILRLGFKLTIAGSTWAQASQLKFQYNKSGAGWNDITSASSVLRLTASGLIADETATTQRLSSPDIFVANNVLTSTTLSTASLGALAGTVEIAGCMKVQLGDVIGTDTIQVRGVNQVGTPPDTVSQQCTISLQIPGGGGDSLLLGNCPG